jgi:pyridoxine 5-phosphate synthase
VKYPRLGVNVDHVATLRQQRDTLYPDPVTAAALAELAGADQITVHLREDRRHIQDRDLALLRQTVQTRLNLEMANTPQMLQIALQTQPEMVTLVPERRAERTTEGGLDVITHRDELAPTIAALRDAAITVSLFIDPDPQQLRASKELGADSVEIHTGDYCEADGPLRRAHLLTALRDAATLAIDLGLIPAAGHGLDYKNVAPVAALGLYEEFNIGHSIVSRAVLVGFERATREMIDALRLGVDGAQR